MMSDFELIQVALRCKEDGNTKFRAGELKSAEGYYRDGISHLETVKNDNKDLKELKVTLLQNLATVCNKSGDYKEAVRICTKALAINNQSFKVLY
jgi:tetratricopeptide (TPR) repeat protein